MHRSTAHSFMERLASGKTAVTIASATPITPTVPAILPAFSPAIRTLDASGVERNCTCRYANMAVINFLISAPGKCASCKQHQTEQHADDRCNARFSQRNH
jgi:hypothetical protein